MKKHNKQFCLIGLAFLLVVGITGCQKENFRIEEPREEKTSLRFTGYKVGKTKVEEIENILNSYMEEYQDMVIVYEGVAENYVEIMTNRIANDQADDLFMISDQALTTYEKKGWYGTKIADLSEEAFIDRFNPMMRQLFTVDGKVAAVPMCMSVVGMMGNMDVLNACGISEMPLTYDEWVEDMRIVKEHGYTPMVNYQGNAASFTFLIAARSAAPFVEQGRDVSSNKTSVEIYERGIRDIYALMEEGLIDREQAVVETDARSYQHVLGEMFASGGVAFAVVPDWTLNSFMEGKPDFKYKLSGLPMGDEGPMVNIRASLMVGVNNVGENKEKAMEFLNFLMQPQQIEQYAAAQYAISPLRGGKPEEEIYEDIVKQIEDNRVYSDTDSRIPFNLIQRLNYTTKQMLQGESIETILTDFDKGVADS